MERKPSRSEDDASSNAIDTTNGKKRRIDGGDDGDTKTTLPLHQRAAGDETGDEVGTVATKVTSMKRWRTHQMAEDYVSFATNLMYPGKLQKAYGDDPLRGQFAIEQLTTLGYLTSPLRRPTVIEQWSPYEIAIFEAHIVIHGKNFFLIAKQLPNKSTKDVIEFYYIWKKTSHGERWKKAYIPDFEDSEDEESFIVSRKKKTNKETSGLGGGEAAVASSAWLPTGMNDES